MRIAIGAICGVLIVAASTKSEQIHGELAGELVQMLSIQGVRQEEILGIDEKGIPVVCGTSGDPTQESESDAQLSVASGLPDDTRGWECIPGVIRDDGVETFRVEIDVNGAVTGVTMDGISAFVVPLI